MLAFYHGQRECIFNLFTFYHHAAFSLCTVCIFDSNHGCFSDEIVADLDRDNFFIAAWLKIRDIVEALFDLFLRMVLISVSEDAMQLLVTSFDPVVGHIGNLKLKILRLGIG